jgi:hypothetical protein
VQVIRAGVRFFILTAILLGFIGCSITVPINEVNGVYVATYPFGTDTISLKSDGTFSQRVAITHKEPLTVYGTWDFDAKESRASFRGVLLVTDNFDHLRSDWQTVTSGIVSFDIERRYFRVLMNSSATYPYLKQ